MPNRSPRAAPRTMLIMSLLLVALSAPGAPLVAQQSGRPTAVAPTSPPPTPEHAVLHRLLGEWSARMEVSAKAGDKPDKVRATETVRTCCDGLFVLTELRGKAKKTPRGGRGILGYDPARGRFLLTWADTRSTSLDMGECDYDQASDTISFVYERLDVGGVTQQVRDVFSWDGPDRRSRTISVIGDDGSAWPLVAIQYRRK